jgi:DNA-binding response OmpR family regulator
MNTGERILVVDDDAAGRYLKTHILSKAGWQVTEAIDGTSARQRLATESYALALLDVKLPDINGIDLCRELKGTYPHLLVLQTSAAFIGKEDRVAGLAGGADGYLVEPIHPEELVATVMALLRRYRSAQDLQERHDSLEQVVVERSQRLAEIGARLETEINQRADAEEQLRHAQKLDVLGQLTGGIAHDFNNVLTIITGNLESLRRHLAKPAHDTKTLQMFADNALLGAQRAVGITRQLLAFSRRQSLTPKVLSVNAFVLNLTYMMKQVLGETIEIETRLDDAAWPVCADPLQFETAILNLAVNARDAMASGGRLIVQTTNQTATDGPRGLKGDYTVVSLIDTGSGMPPEVLKLAVEPFFTTKDVGQGTGLGLAQVHGFVRQSGGEVVIDSAVGRGTRVSLYFPRYTGAEQPEGPVNYVGQPLAAAQHQHATILVVEDDEPVRAHSAGVLREVGYTVLEVCSGPEAIDVLAAHPETQVLITDVGLSGGMSGAELGRLAAAAYPALKILYATGYDDARLKQEHLVDETALIRKPFSFEELTSHVTRLLTHSDSIHHSDSIQPGDTLAPKQSTGVVLLVEDEPMIRLDLADGMSEIGVTVLEAGSLKEARAHFSKAHDAIGALVIDLSLPDGRGDKFVKELRADLPHLPIVITSGYGATGLGDELTQDEALAILAKPCTVEAIVGKLRGLGYG